MGIKRIGKHLLEHTWRVRRIFTPQVLTRIEQPIKAGEATITARCALSSRARSTAPRLFATSRRDGVRSMFSRIYGSGIQRKTTVS